MKKDSRKRWHYQIMTLKKDNESVVPEHYQKDGKDLLSHLEHILPEEEMRGAYRFNIMKYATRAGRKDDITLEIDKITQYAKRWKQFEQSIEKPSPSIKDSTWSRKGGLLLQFTDKYYNGWDILYRIDRTMPNDGLCRLFLSGGSPAYIDDSGFVSIGDSVTYYTKKQLMTFFNECKDDKFTCLEILIEEA